jgi:hypothetical protein
MWSIWSLLVVVVVAAAMAVVAAVRVAWAQDFLVWLQVLHLP